MLRVSKSSPSHSFHAISTKSYGKVGYSGNLIQAVTFLDMCQIYKKYGTLRGKSPQQHCHYPYTSFGFTWRKVKQGVKAPGPLVSIVIVSPWLVSFKVSSFSAFSIATPISALPPPSDETVAFIQAGIVCCVRGCH